MDWLTRDGFGVMVIKVFVILCVLLMAWWVVHGTWVQLFR
jgi:hypothetical protein